MSVSSISSSSLSQSVQDWQVRTQKIQNEFQQLGQDLQAGNLSQAQSDFAALSQNTSAALQLNSSVAQAFSALGTALQSGNISAAQRAYSTLQQDVQQSGLGHRRHQAHGNGATTNSSASNSLSQLFSSLGSILQSGSLSAALTAYATLQDL
jgi:hypothetical protein